MIFGHDCPETVDRAHQLDRYGKCMFCRRKVARSVPRPIVRRPDIFGRLMNRQERLAEERARLDVDGIEEVEL